MLGPVMTLCNQIKNIEQVHFMNNNGNYATSTATYIGS
jgi:hypothetical protein